MTKEEQLAKELAEAKMNEIPKKKMKLKTLKDFGKFKCKLMECQCNYIPPTELKAETIKWVKEDKYFLSKSKNDLNNGNIILERWMKRLNTTEEDLQ